MTATQYETAVPPRAIEPAASVPVSGVVDIGDGHGLVRVSGYRAGPADVYVSAGQIKQYGLRTGDLIEGTARSSAGGRGKYRPLVSVDTVSAGFRERVIAVSGSSARMAEGCKDTPVDNAIIGIVDEVHMD